MFRRNKDTGKKGEELAVQYLKNKKIAVITTNYRKKFGELDIIAKQGETLIFIEVKTRTSSRFGSPEEAVTLQKQKQIIKVAQAYLSEKNLFDLNVRFDVISVTLTDDKAHNIDHIQHAFELQQVW